MSRYGSSSGGGGSSRSGNQECKVYVGNLSTMAGRRDLEESFRQFGTLRNVWVARNPPGFAFIEFEDPRDAQDAVRGHKKRICGRDVTVEMSNGERRQRRSFGGGGGRPPPRRASRNDKCYACGDYGHFARDCPCGGGGGRGGGRRYSGGSYGRDRDSRQSRSRSRSRSRSYSPRRRDSRSKSRSRSRSRSHSHHRRSSSNDKE